MIQEEQLEGSINTPDRQLLWDLRKELKITNELLRAIVENEKPILIENENKEIIEIKSYPCKYPGCNEVLENKGKLMAHMKKHKKEGK